MTIIDHIIAFGCGLYVESGAMPSTITLPPQAFDLLVRQTAERLNQEPFLPSCALPVVEIETGHGILVVKRSEPTP